jgi:hypothetical protein
VARAVGLRDLRLTIDGGGGVCMSQSTTLLHYLADSTRLSVLGKVDAGAGLNPKDMPGQVDREGSLLWLHSVSMQHQVIWCAS